MKRTLAAVLLAAGYALSVGAPAALIVAAPFALTGCERDSDLEDAAEDVGDDIEDTGDELEDKID